MREVLRIGGFMCSTRRAASGIHPALCKPARALINVMGIVGSDDPRKIPYEGRLPLIRYILIARPSPNPKRTSGNHLKIP
jgi:hypothetical protein